MGEVSDEVIFQVFQVFQVLDGLLNDGDVIHNQLWGNEQVVLCVYKFPHWCWRKVDVEHLSLCLATPQRRTLHWILLPQSCVWCHSSWRTLNWWSLPSVEAGMDLQVPHSPGNVCWECQCSALTKSSGHLHASGISWPALLRHCYGAVSRWETAEGGGFGFRNYVLQLSGLMKCLWTKPTFLEGRLSAKAVAPASSGRWFFNMFAVAKKTPSSHW